MGKIPKLGLLESTFKNLTHGKVIGGAHPVRQVEFTEKYITYKGFYKKLEPTYPVLLAKIDVAVSAFMRFCQGERAAEVRLVFNDAGEVTGTLSIMHDDFLPLCFRGESGPENEEEKKWVIPDKDMLLKENVIETYMVRAIHGDDDLHAGNAGLKKHIDYEMSWYPFVIWMKGPRTIIPGVVEIVPNTRLEFSQSNYEKFPFLDGDNGYKPFHWPSFKHPGILTIPTVLPLFQDAFLKEVLPKGYKDPEPFIALAGSRKAHQQKVAAALKILLTYQPELFKSHLTDLFGDLTLDYTALGEKLSITYEEKFPGLCNKQTDKHPFSDWVLKFFHKEIYDKFYSCVVFYGGCEDNKQNKKHKLPLLSTHDELYLKPSYFQNIRTWVEEQNKTTFKDKEKQFNLDELVQRYHQVWRDSFALVFANHLSNLYSILNELLKKASDNQVLKTIEGRKPTDEGVDDAWLLFSSVPDLSKETLHKLIKVDPKHNSRPAIELLAEFSSKLYAMVKDYYCIDRKSLVEKNNVTFIEKLKELIIMSDYESKIISLLGSTTPGATRFSKICLDLQELTKEVNFVRHLLATDEQAKHFKTKDRKKEMKLLPIDSQQVLDGFNASLFDYVNTLSRADFDNYVIEVIEKHYVQSLNFFRAREQPVKDYLARSALVPNAQRLAYILSSGNRLEDIKLGNLNKSLITYFVPMIKGMPESIQESLSKKTLGQYTDLLTRSALTYAQKSERFIHAFREDGMTLFCDSFFQLIDSMSDTLFKQAINRATTRYDEEKWSGVSIVGYFASPSRTKDVKGYLTNHDLTNRMRVAMIFRGKDTSSTLTQYVFEELILVMKSKINQDWDVQDEKKKFIMRDDSNLFINKKYQSILEIDIKDVTVKKDFLNALYAASKSIVNTIDRKKQQIEHIM